MMLFRIYTPVVCEGCYELGYEITRRASQDLSFQQSGQLPWQTQNTTEASNKDPQTGPPIYKNFHVVRGLTRWYVGKWLRQTLQLHIGAEIQEPGSPSHGTIREFLLQKPEILFLGSSHEAFYCFGSI